jgi:hypothetical protein
VFVRNIPDSVCRRSFDIKLEIPALVALEDNLSRFGDRHIASSSIIIFSIISLLVNSFNVFLIIFIIRKEY